MIYWVIYYKCTAKANSGIRHDDAEFYFNQAVIPAKRKDTAISLLDENLSNDNISIQEIISIIDYQEINLSVDPFEIKNAYFKAKLKQKLVTGLFIPSDVAELINLFNLLIFMKIT